MNVDKALELLKILLEEGRRSTIDLKQRLNLEDKDFVPLVYILERTGIIIISDRTVSLSSQTRSILFEPLVIHEGTRQFIKEILLKATKFDSAELKIPAILMPILLLRSTIPYFGLILQDIEKEEGLQLQEKQKKFLYDFFSPFKFDYENMIEKWKELHFTAEDFYNLSLILNRKLSKTIKTESKYPILSTKKEKVENKIPRRQKKIVPNKKIEITKIPEKETKIIDQRFYNIPMEALRAFFGDEPEKKGKVIHQKNAYPLDNLEKLLGMKINTQKLLSYVNQVDKSKGQITLVVFNNGILRWDYEDRIGKFPSLFLDSEGIYADKETLKQFSEHRINQQTDYLSKLIKQTFTKRRTRKMEANN